jgi:MoaA/NifB/PqqE/SkfB family radical SAM enzyme
MAIFPLEHFEKSVAESPMPQRFEQSDIKPYFYNIVLGNLCNLSCVMCNPYYSSRVATDFKRIKLVSSDQPSLLDWTRDNASWKKFIDHIDSNTNIVCVHFQGGEPLLHKRFREFLQHCVDTNHTNFHLTIVTNGTIFDWELIELFRKFKTCQIEISIETMSNVNQYIRYPVEQEQLVDNIKKFLTCRDQQLSVVLRTVPQLLSVLDYVSLLEFCLEYSVCVDTNIIDRPDFLKPAVWPDYIRQVAADRLEKFKTLLDVNDAKIELNLRNQSQIKINLKQNADMVLGSLYEPLTNRKELQHQAQEYFNKIDGLRQLSITDYCPEFANIHG